MMQGDSYRLSIEIINEKGVPVTSDDVADVEITIGSLRKKFVDKEVSYKDGKWLFPLTQEDTFKLPASRVKAQVRVVWTSGDVEGASLGEIRIQESISKEVL